MGEYFKIVLVGKTFPGHEAKRRKRCPKNARVSTLVFATAEQATDAAAKLGVRRIVRWRDGKITEHRV